MPVKIMRKINMENVYEIENIFKQIPTRNELHQKQKQDPLGIETVAS